MFNQVVRSVAALGVAAFSCHATAAQAQPVEAVHYSLPAQELERSVREVAVRSGTNILASAKLLSGHKAAPLEGRFTPREAIEHLLAGTGLSLESVGDSLVIRRGGPAGGPATGEAAGEGEVIVTGTHLRGAPPTSPVIVIGRKDIDRTGATSVERTFADRGGTPGPLPLELPASRARARPSGLARPRRARPRRRQPVSAGRPAFGKPGA